MNQRPELDKNLSSEEFRSFYYLKEELAAFCRTNGLPTSGSKEALADRVARYLACGEIVPAAAPRKVARTIPRELMEDTKIESNFVCSEVHRAFFKTKIGKSFSFNVAFQKWLKENTGKTYAEAIEAYHKLRETAKTGKTKIDKQFEYNTYIRDFFADNKGATLAQAIECWKYKKSIKGHSRYEKSDLTAPKSVPEPGYKIREMRAEEYPLLENFLYEAIFQRDEKNLLPKFVINEPALKIYIENFGGLPHDFCLCAEIDEAVVGAVWARTINGFGHVDEKTPELATSLFKAHRSRGIGTALLEGMLKLLAEKGYEKVSLAVQKDNYALKMYENLGFRRISENEEEYIMEYKLSPQKVEIC